MTEHPNLPLLDEVSLHEKVDEEQLRLMPQDEESLSSTLPDDDDDSEFAGIQIKTNILRVYLASCYDFLKRAFLFILPSFITSCWTRPERTMQPEPLRPTAYLDGIRGIAAWAVFNSHVGDVCVRHAKANWGHDGENYSLLKLPIIRLLYKGDFAVALFFVISGFALSISPIAAIRKSPRDPATAFKKISSAVFRRSMRLMIPSWTSTLIVFTMIRLNIFGALKGRLAMVDSLVANAMRKFYKLPPRNPSFFKQLLDLWHYDTNLIRIFWQPRVFRETQYNGVLWTIKVEYQCSLALYLTQAALYPMRRRYRISCMLFLVVFGVAINARDLPLFWSGYLIAEFS